MLNFDRSTVKHGILRIFKMIATSGFLAALKCSIFVFGRGSTGGAYSASPDPLIGLRGPTSKGTIIRGKGKGREEGPGEEGDGRDRPPFRKFKDPPL